MAKRLNRSYKAAQLLLRRQGNHPRLRIVQANFPNGPLRARELPKEYEDALKKLHPILGLLEERVSKAHHQTMCSSPALRSGITIRSTDAAFRQHGFTFASRPDDKLYTFLAFLLQEDKTHLWQVGRIFDQLDRLTQDPAAHRRISPLIASILSQWGVINNFKSILASHRPAVDATELLPAGFEQRLQKWKPLIGPVILGIDPDPALAARAFPISNFTYPKGPRDSTWAAKCEDVDAVFAAFWKAADRFLIKRCGNELFALGTQVVGTIYGCAHELVIAWRVFIVLSSNSAQRSTAVASKVPVRTMPKAAALVPFGGAEQGPEVKEEPSTPKAKPKTRGVAAITVESKGNEQATETSVAIAPTPVSARIQTAFAQIGFDLQKTRGSAWTFHHPDGPKTVIVQTVQWVVMAFVFSDPFQWPTPQSWSLIGADHLQCRMQLVREFLPAPYADALKWQVLSGLVAPSPSRILVPTFFILQHAASMLPTCPPVQKI
ncbi:hypothetical protein B0H14DRAFT_2556785 [Mycena olivaceomarginata]|nr:hypothetical protein B0H14DRAFT_2556785 [Mycena olivaceomarginata]